MVVGQEGSSTIISASEVKLAAVNALSQALN